MFGISQQKEKFATPALVGLKSKKRKKTFVRKEASFPLEKNNSEEK